MILFIINVLLATGWMFMWGAFDLWTFVAGFVVGYIVLGITSRTTQPGHDYSRKLWNWIVFLVYFIKILIQANWQVASEVITPGFNMTPRLVRYPVKGMTPVQITTLANLITLTPGTLSVDVNEQLDYLYIHCMYARDRQSAIAGLDELRDKMLKKVF